MTQVVKEVAANHRKIPQLISCCAFNLHFEAAEGQRSRGEGLQVLPKR
jgi:hypothetical protein